MPTLTLFRNPVPVTGILLATLLLTGTLHAAAQTTTKIKGKGSEVVVKQKSGDQPTISKNQQSRAASSAADEGVMVGGAMLLPSRDLIANVTRSQDHTTLMSAVQAAGLVELLKSTGPFTVFAPTNSAFQKLPGGSLDNLMMPEGKSHLTQVLTYHVVPGRLTIADLKDGQVLTTVAGQTLTVLKTGSRVLLRDGKGKTATVTTPDVLSTNGLLHIVDAVLLPGT